MLNSLTVASMAPNITESIFFLELDSMLIGRTLYCDFPKEAESIEIIGTFIEMNYEKMLILNPDIIVFSGNLTSKERTFLEENKIQYADVKMERAEDVIPAIMRIDSLLSNSSHREKIDSLKNSLSFSLSARSTKIYIEISSKPLISANKNSYVGSMLELMGFIVFSDSNYSPYSPVSQEDVIKFNPSAIIVFHDESNVNDRLGWDKINAVKNNKIFYLNKEETDILSRPGPRIAEAKRILEEFREKISL